MLVFTCFNRRILSRSGWVLKPARGSSSTGLCPAGEIGDETPLNGCQEEHKMGSAKVCTHTDRGLFEASGTLLMQTEVKWLCCCVNLC